jgi:hypothetical protein
LVYLFGHVNGIIEEKTAKYDIFGEALFWRPLVNEHLVPVGETAFFVKTAPNRVKLRIFW